MADLKRKSVKIWMENVKGELYYHLIYNYYFYSFAKTIMDYLIREIRNVTKKYFLRRLYYEYQENQNRSYILTR